MVDATHCQPCLCVDWTKRDWRERWGRKYVPDYWDRADSFVVGWIFYLSHREFVHLHSPDFGGHIDHFPLPARRNASGLEQKQSYCDVSSRGDVAFLGKGLPGKVVSPYSNSAYACCGVRPKGGANLPVRAASFVVMQQAENVILGELLPAFEEIQFNRKGKPSNFSPQLLN